MASENRVTVDGATLRLALARPDASGRIEGVLAIDLQPGWKTYWIDPGPVGLAPVLDMSRSRGLAAFEFAYPAPKRFREGDQSSVGYETPLLIPFRAQAEASVALQAEMSLTIGLCREFCVPVQERLVAVPSDSLSIRAEILAARRMLPEPASSDQVELDFDGRLLQARIALPPGRNDVPDLFPVARHGWMLGQPTKAPDQRDGAWIFFFPATSDTRADETLPPIDLVLTAGEITQSFRNVPVACDPTCPLPTPAKVQR